MKEENKTQVIYLNEEDRPTLEKKETFKKWCVYNSNGVEQSHVENFIRINGVTDLNKLHDDYIEYINNLPEKKPIEFTSRYDKEDGYWEIFFEDQPRDYDKIFVFKKDNSFFFWCIILNQVVPDVFEGKLNSGTV